eukprot:SAG31_NODE_330_length_17593_cov_4.817891_17_plen_187_part_00
MTGRWDISSPHSWLAVSRKHTAREPVSKQDVQIGLCVLMSCRLRWWHLVQFSCRKIWKTISACHGLFHLCCRGSNPGQITSQKLFSAIHTCPISLQLNLCTCLLDILQHFTTTLCRTASLRPGCRHFIGNHSVLQFRTRAVRFSVLDYRLPQQRVCKRILCDLCRWKPDCVIMEYAAQVDGGSLLQ